MDHQLQSLASTVKKHLGPQGWPRHLCNSFVLLPSFQKLILSETTIFDVLPTFFYHSNQVVRMAALEVKKRLQKTSFQ